MRRYLSREGENQRGKALKRVPLERVVWALIGCAHVGETEGEQQENTEKGTKGEHASVGPGRIAIHIGRIRAAIWNGREE